LGSLLIFSSWDIEDDLAVENVRSWEKETCGPAADIAQ
jgi:hypothetical protein